MNIRPLALALSALLLVPVAAAAAEEEVVHDHWFAQFNREHKAGWAHERRVRTELDGKTVVITETESEMMRGPDGEKLAKPIVSSTRFVEDEDGAVLSYSTSIDIGMGPQTREGTVKDGVISAKFDGKPQTTPYPEGAVGPAAIDRAMAAKLEPNAAGKAIRFKAIDAQAEPVSWKYPAETKLVDVLGHYRWLFAVERSDSTGIPDIIFPDGNGGSFGGAINFGLIRSFRTEEVVAKADRDPASWMTSAVVAPDRVIPVAAHRKRVVLRLSRKGGAVGALPESASQAVVTNAENGTVDVTLTDGEPKGDDLVVWIRPYNGDDYDKTLIEGSPLVEKDNGRLKQFGERIVGQLQDGLNCARMIELRTKQMIRPAPANVGFQSAAEVVSSRTGDSTETAVLAVAFARSLGLPARLVAGFVYWPAGKWSFGRYPNGAFAFHAWAEIYAGHDVWHPVDPMRMDGTEPKESMRDMIGHGGFDATHVAVLRSAVDTTTPFTAIVLPVLEFMDGLSIEVLEPAK